jgi:hypothetical protein
MLLFIMFQVCSSYMLDIVVIDDEFMHMFAKRLAQDARGLSGRHYVSMVLRYCLPTNAFYTLGHVVDHGCDTPVESFIVHSPFVEQVEHGCEGRQALFLILVMFLMHRSRVNYAVDESVYTWVYKRLSK